jgi:uncharacterized protein YuzE
VKEVKMRIIFDPETDTLSLIFRDEKIAESDEVREGVIIDYSKDGKIVSIEILDASEQISEPQGILYEVKGKEKVVA